MTLGILPVVGSSGFYELAPPFDSAAVNQVEYTCKAIRRISDYLANNEKIKEEVYDGNGLDESIWTEDSVADAYVVSLQSRTGHWVYVPVRYVLSYPSVNGVQYRSVMLGFSLPSLPVEQDISAVMAEMKDIVEDSLGVVVVAKMVETSKVVLIPHVEHATKRQERAAASAGRATMYARNIALRQENDALLAKVAQLESYIKLNLVP